MLYRDGGKLKVDESYYGMIPFKALMEAYGDDADYLMMYLYYMHHPRSPYREVRNLEKGERIRKDVFPSRLKDWDEDVDLLYLRAKEFYCDRVLKGTPLYRAAEGYKEAMYNLTKIVSDPKSTASDIKTASIELDALPAKYEKMLRQAESQELDVENLKGKRVIRKREQLPSTKKMESHG